MISVYLMLSTTPSRRTSVIMGKCVDPEQDTGDTRSSGVVSPVPPAGCVPPSEGLTLLLTSNKYLY